MIGKIKKINPRLEVDEGRWMPPMKEYVKINVYGATTSEENMTAYSGIMRDYRGKVKWSFLFNIKRGNSFLVVRCAILMGLR